jgi:hypothetical protein
MQRIKVSSHFFLDELVPPSIYLKWGARAICFIDYRILMAADWLHDTIGLPVIGNNWISGGQYKESVLREFNTTTGAKMSQHKFGRAFDAKIKGMTPHEVHEVILKHQEFLVQNQLITTLENADFTKTWTHIDCRFTGLDHIQIVNP